MLLTLEDWKREWGINNLVFASECEPLLPPIAREFLISYGLPRRIIFENPLEGDWEEYVSSEISFELLLKPLVSYDKTLNDYDPDVEVDGEERDDPWSQQIVIGEDEACEEIWSYCVHQFNETVTRIDVEATVQEHFVNSSLRQFGESLFLAVQWSKTIQQASMENWKSSLYELAGAIEAIDAAAFRQPYSDWLMLIQYALEHELGFLEITADPKRSKPRF
jgi:hypothetical protein